MKDIVLSQLRVYESDVNIFGKTFWFMKDYFPGAEYNEKLSNDQIWYYRHGKQISLDTYHPGRKGQKYVDALIVALHVAQKEISNL